MVSLSYSFMYIYTSSYILLQDIAPLPPKKCEIYYSNSFK